MAGIFNIRRKTQNAKTIQYTKNFWFKICIIPQCNNASHDFVGNGYSQFFFNREKHAPSALHGFKLIIIVIKQVVGPDCKTVSKRIENIEEIRPYFKLGYSS